MDAFYSERIPFIMDTEPMLSGKNDGPIIIVSICTVPFCLGSRVHYLLERRGRWIGAPYDPQSVVRVLLTLVMIDIDILPGVCLRLALQKLIRLIPFDRSQL